MIEKLTLKLIFSFTFEISLGKYHVFKLIYGIDIIEKLDTLSNRLLLLDTSILELK